MGFSRLHTWRTGRHSRLRVFSSREWIVVPYLGRAQRQSKQWEEEEAAGARSETYANVDTTATK